MEELKCKECGAIIEAGKDACPSCGCPVDEDVKNVNSNNDDKSAITVAEVEKMKTSGTVPKVYGQNQTPQIAAPLKSKKSINILSIVAFVIGIVIIVLGKKVMSKEAAVGAHNASKYDITGYSFGADFYTEIYNANDTIVSALSDIDSGVATISKSSDDIIESVYYSVGMLIIAIGLATSAVSLCCMLKRQYI